METPDSPSVPASEPVREQKAVDMLMDEVEDADRQQLSIVAVGEWLDMLGVSVDERGFIVQDGEYVTPYIFSEDKYSEIDIREDSVWDAFVPREEEAGSFTNRLHLSDLHSFVQVDGEWFPVRDSFSEVETFNMEALTGFTVVTDWSDVAQSHSKYLDAGVVVWGKEAADEYQFELRCLNPFCECTADVREWYDSDSMETRCPDCDGQWGEDMTLCTECGEWHRGTEWEGESRHAKPWCPHCNASMTELESYSVYDEPTVEDLTL